MFTHPLARRRGIGSPRSPDGRRWRCCAAALLLLASGCDSAGDPRDLPESVSARRIVVIAEDREEPLWSMLGKVAASGRSRRRPLEILVDAPSLSSATAQQELLRKLTSPQPLALCLIPTELDALRGQLDALVRGGLPVILIGRDLPETRRTAYCGPVEYEIGQAAARVAATLAAHGSRTVILAHAGADDRMYGERYAGFVRELPLFRDVTLLREVDCGRTRGDALTLIRSEARRYPRAGCWVLLGDWPFRALPDAERLLGPDDRIVLCHVGLKYLPRLRRTDLAALVTADLARAAEQAVSLAIQWTDPKAVPEQTIVTIPVEVVTPENLADYERRFSAASQPAS